MSEKPVLLLAVLVFVWLLTLCCFACGGMCVECACAYLCVWRSVHTDHSSGDVICRGCGVVLTGRIIDEGPEWRTLANDDRMRPDQARAGVSYCLHMYVCYEVMCAHFTYWLFLLRFSRWQAICAWNQ